MYTVRSLLRKMEDEGYLVKGFLLEGSSTLMWMLAEDADRKVDKVREQFVLNNQDNLHLYLRPYLKETTGSFTDSVVMRGTKVIGWFKGKLTASGAKVEDFQGDPAAYRYLRMVASSVGVTIDESDKEVDEWTISEFYAKTNPGGFDKRYR